LQEIAAMTTTTPSQPGNSLPNTPGTPIEVLFQKHFVHVQKRVFRWTKNAETAAEAVSEAFLKLWQKRKAGAVIPNERAWLVIAARNWAIDEARKAMRRKTTTGIELADMASSAKTPPTILAWKEERRRVRRQLLHTLASFSDGEKQLLALRLKGKTIRAIESLLRTPEIRGKSRARVAKHLIRLFDRLQEHQGDLPFAEFVALLLACSARICRVAKT
jgi:RNA polymerase sigma factor (sigma-70 family)